MKKSLLVSIRLLLLGDGIAGAATILIGLTIGFVLTAQGVPKQELFSAGFQTLITFETILVSLLTSYMGYRLYKLLPENKLAITTYFCLILITSTVISNEILTLHKLATETLKASLGAVGWLVGKNSKNNISIISPKYENFFVWTGFIFYLFAIAVVILK